MNNNQEALKEKIIQANIEYHTKLSDTYNKTQPHYFPENIERVESHIAKLAETTGGESLLDLGCGTGFIIHIAQKYFKRVVGVDITKAMLDQVDTSNGKIELYQGQTEDLSFLDKNSFDVCTGYSFLHHLHDPTLTLREAYRCLRPGGQFYSDLDPNLHYWRLMSSLKGYENLEGFVSREVRSVVEMVKSIENTDLQAETIELAEYHKGERGGLDPEFIKTELIKIGFSSVSVTYKWFLGQGQIIQQQSQHDALIIENYLRKALPATRSCFKYLSINATK